MSHLGTSGLAGARDRTTAPADLRAPATDPWARVRVPDGWGPIADLGREVHADLARLTEQIVSCIEREIPAYASLAVSVPDEDLAASVVRNLEMLLVGIAEHRGPTPEEIQVRGELGHRRAEQGLPVEALVQAYQIGYRELWQALVHAVPAGDTDVAKQLLVAATTTWRWVHEVTTAITMAHGETVRGQEARVVGARQRFTELLVGGEPGEEARRLAGSLAFDPDGEFLATVVRAEAVDGLDAARLQRWLVAAGGAHTVVARGPRVIAISQGLARDAAAAAARDAFPAAAVGLGMVRSGLDGARTSLVDAEQALELAGEGEIADFDDVWLWASLSRVQGRLHDLLAVGTRVATDHPHLAETVAAYADAGFAISGTARRLELHANSVAYRLDRWHALTGWDPRTFPGLVRSLAALHLHA